MEFLQLWILPETASLPPSLQQRQFTKDDRANRLLKVIAREGEDVVKVHQDAAVYVAALSEGTAVTHDFGAGRGGYLYLIEGALRLGDASLQTGDAVKIFEENDLPIRSEGPSELLLVDIPLRFTPVGVWAR